MPLLHVHGLMAGLLAPLAAGAAVVLPAGARFVASTFWADAVQYGVTYFTVVPTIHQVWHALRAFESCCCIVASALCDWCSKR
jgi:acyl-CoA synthetase (AMP-forming)/AMP-acid ligase II